MVNFHKSKIPVLKTRVNRLPLAPRHNSAHSNALQPPHRGHIEGSGKLFKIGLEHHRALAQDSRLAAIELETLLSLGDMRFLAKLVTRIQSETILSSEIRFNNEQDILYFPITVTLSRFAAATNVSLEQLRAAKISKIAINIRTSITTEWHILLADAVWRLGGLENIYLALESTRMDARVVAVSVLTIVEERLRESRILFHTPHGSHDYCLPRVSCVMLDELEAWSS